MKFNRVKNLFFIIVLFIISQSMFAKPIVVLNKTVIDKPTLYKNMELDLSNGSFEITNHATLTIQDCILRGTITPKNTQLISLMTGHLILKGNRFIVTSVDIPSTPSNPSIFDAITVNEGTVTIVGNQFTIDTPYMVGLLATTGSHTKGFYIAHNRIENFHGGILLKNSHDAYVAENIFKNVSISNILILQGSNSLFEKNTMLFSGNNNVGDAIDIMDSDHIQVIGNFISSGSCYSMVILRGKDILIDKNQIVNGITYAISIIPDIKSMNKKDIHFRKLVKDPLKENKSDANQYIRITHNYISQNRYGLAASYVDGLVVEDNIFIQKFSSAAQRKFWTDNHVLLKNVMHLTWQRNRYKEAFPQEEMEDWKATKLVPFPISGGVGL